LPAIPPSSISFQPIIFFPFVAKEKPLSLYKVASEFVLILLGHCQPFSSGRGGNVPSHLRTLITSYMLCIIRESSANLFKHPFKKLKGLSFPAQNTSSDTPHLLNGGLVRPYMTTQDRPAGRLRHGRASLSREVH
jgi:hypothetical protein